MSSDSPVFLDRKGRRSFCTNVALGLGGLLTLTGIGAVLLGVIFAPELPRLDTPERLEERLRAEREGAEGGPLLRSSGDLPVSPGRAKVPFQEQAPLLRFAFVNPKDP